MRFKSCISERRIVIYPCIQTSQHFISRLLSSNVSKIQASFKRPQNEHEKLTVSKATVSFSCKPPRAPGSCDSHVGISHQEVPLSPGAPQMEEVEGKIWL